MYAIDAAQPFDFEARARAKADASSKLKIGIIGFGTFGQFLAKRLVARGHKVRQAGWQGGPDASRLIVWPDDAFCLDLQVITTSRTNYDQLAQTLGVEFYPSADDFCEEHPEVGWLGAAACLTIHPS